MSINKNKNECIDKIHIAKINPVIVCVAKMEQPYIEEFVKYHLKLGFECIYLYDNEDLPTYKKILHKYLDKVVVTHLPGKNYVSGSQYEALRRFVKNRISNPRISHVIHIDIDEFIVLKKHRNIKEFIYEYMKTADNSVMCGGIGINWRFFGSSGHSNNIEVPNTIRFTHCEQKINPHIKTLFNKKMFSQFNECHSIRVKNNNYPIRSTNGQTIDGPVSTSPTNEVIQLNHYKCKTFSEFQNIRTRLRADLQNDMVYPGKKLVESDEHVLNTFNAYDLNETEDMTAYNFYKN